MSPIRAADPSLAKAGLNAAQTAIADTARSVYGSAEMNQLRQAFESGVASEAQVHGYTVIFDPGLPASGFSLASFGETGFVIGPQGMASELELAHTIAHELYRVNMTEIPTLGVDAVRAANETASASDFAATVGPLIAGLGG